MAYTTVQQQLPTSSDMGELSEKKWELVNEMNEFTKEGDKVIAASASRKISL